MDQLPANKPITVTVNMRFGPAMSALTDKQRAFVVSWNNAGGKNAAEAWRAAGGAPGSADAARVYAHRLMHNPSIQAAIREDALARFVGDLASTLQGIDEIASNPQHPQRLKALTTKLHHAGLIERTVIEENHTVTLTYEQRADQLKHLAAQLRVPVENLLPPGTTVTDAEFTEEQPASSAGLEDFI